MSTNKIADSLGISQPVYSGYERGELSVHGELLVKLAGILKVSTDELEKSAPSRAPRDRRLLRRLQDVERTVELPCRYPRSGVRSYPVCALARKAEGAHEGLAVALGELVSSDPGPREYSRSGTHASPTQSRHASGGG
jgi:transcriptional regulator with XRE-family HTH domain